MVSLAGWGGLHWEEGHFSSAPSSRYPGAQRAELNAPQLTFQSIALRDVRLDFEGLRLAIDDENRPRLLDLKEVAIRSALWTDADATALLKKRVPALTEAAVTFQENGGVRLAGRLGPASLGVDLALAHRRGGKEDQLEIRVVQFIIGDVSVPKFFLSRYGVRAIPLGPTARRPYGIRLSGLRVVPRKDNEPGIMEVTF